MTELLNFSAEAVEQGFDFGPHLVRQHQPFSSSLLPVGEDQFFQIRLQRNHAYFAAEFILGNFNGVILHIECLEWLLVRLVWSGGSKKLESKHGGVVVLVKGRVIACRAIYDVAGLVGRKIESHAPFKFCHSGLLLSDQFFSGPLGVQITRRFVLRPLQKLPPSRNTLVKCFS